MKLSIIDKSIITLSAMVAMFCTIALLNGGTQLTKATAIALVEFGQSRTIN